MTETIWHSLYGVEVGNGLAGELKTREKRFVESIDILGFTCLDLGFNYGWWSWLFLKNIGKEGRVYAWEPNNFLFENYLAKWPFKNLTGYSYALSDKNGEQNFYIQGEKGEKSGINSLEDVKDSASPMYIGDPPIEIRKIKTKTQGQTSSQKKRKELSVF